MAGLIYFLAGLLTGIIICGIIFAIKKKTAKKTCGCRINIRRGELKPIAWTEEELALLEAVLEEENRERQIKNMFG